MNSKNNQQKKKTITIKIDESIKEKLEKYQQYGYKASEIITMGIILLEDSKNFEILMDRKIIEEKILQKIIELKESIDNLQIRLNKKIPKEERMVDEVIRWIDEGEITPREQILQEYDTKLNPLGQEYFNEIAQIRGIPREKLINEIINRYTEEHLKDLNITTSASQPKNINT